MNWTLLFDISPYDWPSIGTAIFCGSMIGLERQLRGKPVGIRTSALIILGTYLFLSTAFMLEGGTMDPSRVVGQVITGIGFLGAGVMLSKEGVVVGVTSAASIWVLAAIGVIISTGSLIAAVKLSVLVVTILYGVDLLEGQTKTFTRGVHTRVREFTEGRKKARRQNRLRKNKLNES